MIDAREEHDWKFASFLAYYSATAFGGGKNIKIEDFNPYIQNLKKGF